MPRVRNLLHPHTSSGRLVQIVVLVVGLAAVLALSPWVKLAWTANVSRQTERMLVVGFLRGLTVGYGLALGAVVYGFLVGAVRVRRARRRGTSRRAAARAFGLAGSTLLGLGLLEAGALAWSAWSHRMPDLPTRFSGDRDPDEVRLLVIGESSARGEPFDDWLSIGDIVAWQLERVIPGRRFRVEMKARGGNTLEVAHRELEALDFRPDAILLYAGHNEFMGRFSWPRRLPFYDDEKPPLSLSVVRAWAEGHSALCGLIGEAVENWRVSEAPPKGVKHRLVDTPAFTTEEARALRDDFESRLEAIAEYGETIGALSIFVVPAGNVGGYDPNRSYLDPSTPRAERQAIERAFREAVAAEKADPRQSAAFYQKLLTSQPSFAEAHFRLACLLAESGDSAEAARHFRMARDLDGLPQRCRSDFQDAYRRAVQGHDVLLVEAPDVLRSLAPLDDRMFQDAHHTTLLGYIALAQEVLDQLQARGAFGWPEGTPAPRIDPEECAAHFGIGQEEWVSVCARSGAWYRINANLRFDPSLRLSKARRYDRAVSRLKAGGLPESVGVPGLGVRPDLRRRPGGFAKEAGREPEARRGVFRPVPRFTPGLASDSRTSERGVIGGEARGH